MMMSCTLQTHIKSLHIGGYLITRQSPFQWSQTAGFHPLFNPGCAAGMAACHVGPVTGILLYLYAVHCPVVSTRPVRCSMGHISPSGWLMGFEYHIHVISEGPN